MPPHILSRRDACRIAIRAQLLDRNRPSDLVDMVRRITMLQLDPTAAIAPNVDLVSWSRLGASYARPQLDRAIEKRQLIELQATIRPAEDIALYRAEMQAWRNNALTGWRATRQAWVEANDECRRDILSRLSKSGPLPSRELPDTCAVEWKSTGWTNNQNVIKLLDLMVSRGEVAVAGRRGSERLWDLAERVYPDDPIVPIAEAETRRNARRLSALGIARAKGSASPVEPLDVRESGEEAIVEGVKGSWRVDPAQLDQPFTGRAALLSPFDRLLHDRKRLLELFQFEYLLEMYKPAASRRWGYFALPILYADRLVGKLDAAADRATGRLRINALHWDVEPSKAMGAAVDREIRNLARWLELDVVAAN